MPLKTLLLGLVLLGGSARADAMTPVEWPQFRGPQGQGIGASYAQIGRAHV